MSFDNDETSIENAQPIECYIFNYNGVDYTYTTTYYSQTFSINGISYTFVPEYIKRGDSLKQSDSSSSDDNCIITVSRSNSVALLYQGTPPELDSVTVQIYRIHGENNNEHTRILRGNVSQVRFFGSDAELTVTIEHVLVKEIPRGKLSYFCQNCIYDNKCKLNREDYKHKCWVDGDTVAFTIQSSNLLEIGIEGYYTDGYMQMGNSFRQIVEHKGDKITIKYPINASDKSDVFYVYPGCNNLFTQCNEKFKNTENFSGIPYQQPYDAFKHSVDKGVYWVDGNIVYRDTDRKIYTMNL